MASDPREFIRKLPIVHHHEVAETFADSMATTFFDGNTLRLEFTSARIEEASPKPTGARHVVCRLVITAPCAIDLINQMRQFTAQLEQAGIVKAERVKSEPQKTN
jgi:hypothetical protein